MLYLFSFDCLFFEILWDTVGIRPHLINKNYVSAAKG